MRRIWTYAFLTIALYAFPRCSRDERPSAASIATERGAQPQDGGTLVRRLDADISTLNPLTGSSSYDRLVAKYLFTPLVYFDHDARLVSGLARSWERSGDGRIYRFVLDERATFADGRPVRASDVIFTLRKAVDPTSEAMQVASSFEFVDFAHTQALDDHVVEIAFTRTLASQLAAFTDLFVLPEHVYSKGSFRNDFNVNAVGSGPYRLVRRDPGKLIRLERRSDYWREHPHIQTVVFRVITDQSVAWSALQAGEIDETAITSDRWRSTHDDPQFVSSIRFLTFYAMGYNAIAWNNSRDLFADEEVRRALGMCLPVDSIITNLYQGMARSMTGPFSREEWAFNSGVSPLRYDPVAAQQILVDRGWRDRDGDGVLDRDGVALSFEFIIISGNPSAQRLAETLQAEWKRIGVVARLQILDGATAIQKLLAGSYDAAYVGWNLDTDPDPYSLFHSSAIPPQGQNIVRYKNSAADVLIERGRYELDQRKRERIYRQFHALVAADQPYTWVVQSSSKWCLARRVRGVEVAPIVGLFSWYPGELGWWVMDELGNRQRQDTSKEGHA